MRAAAYIRVSTQDQTEFSPDAQLKQIKDYANKHNIKLLDEHIYADEGISGRSTDKRIAFNKMINNAKKTPRPFDVILIHKFNRFARNREDAIIFKSLLKRDCGIKVISITEPIEDDKIGIIIESVLDAFSEYYSINLSEEVKKGMGEKASRGGFQTRPPYGYHVQDNKLIVDPYESEIVKLIYNKYLNDELMFIDIAKELNDVGIRTKSGNLFQSKTIKYILTNPTYKGYLLWNKKEKNGLIRDYSEWILAKGDYEPIISNELFDKVQNKMNFNKMIRPKCSKSNHTYKHMLSGLIVCSQCGGRMVFCKSNQYRYFRCRKAKDGACSMNKSVQADILLAEVINQIDHDFNFITLVTKDAISDQHNDIIHIYNQQIKKINNKLQLAKQAYLNGVDCLSEYQDNKEHLHKEQENLLSYIKSLTIENKSSNEVSAIHWNKISKFLDNDMEVGLKNKVLKSFVKEIILDLYNDYFEIIYYTDD